MTPASALPASDPRLLEFLAGQRWFGAKELELVDTAVLDRAELGGGLADVLVETRYGSGAHDNYQLLVRSGPEAAFDALGDPAAVARLVELANSCATVPSELGEIELCSLGELARGEVTPLDVEQSNSSVVVGGELLVKLYRRLEPGINPELEVLRFLAGRDVPTVPELRGWWSYTGSVMTTTLGIFQRFLPGARDGWSVALELLEADPARFVAAARRFGTILGELHSVLASDDDDPVFAPEDATPESVPLLTATVDDEIQQAFDHLPDDEAVAPIAGLGEAVRSLLDGLATAGPPGRLIRNHGDLHLGQMLSTDEGWFIVDFEGEPARSLPERRVKRSPLRDVAGMLRSFSYATIAAGCSGDGTEEKARTAFLDAYLASVERAAIVPPQPQLDRLLHIFELEKVVYELRYELSHRPDWVHIPVAGIGRLLQRAPA